MEKWHFFILQLSFPPPPLAKAPSSLAPLPSGLSSLFLWIWIGLNRFGVGLVSVHRRFPTATSIVSRRSSRQYSHSSFIRVGNHLGEMEMHQVLGQCAKWKWRDNVRHGGSENCEWAESVKRLRNMSGLRCVWLLQSKNGLQNVNDLKSELKGSGL